MMSPSSDKQADIIDDFNTTSSRYFDDILNINNVYFDKMVSQICHSELQLSQLISLILKVRKRAKIRNRYNQVLHLTQNNTWENNKLTIRHHNREPSDQPFPSR